MKLPELFSATRRRDRARRVVVVGVVLSIFTILVASVTIASPLRMGSGMTRPAERPARGLVYRSLRSRPSGPCGDLFEVDTRVGDPVCTHGPDPAPTGIDVRERREPTVSAAAFGPTAEIPCIDDGQSGPRVHAIYAVASDVTDRYEDTVDDIRRWAEAMEGVVESSAQETGGERGIRWLTQSTGTGCELVVDHVVMDPSGDNTFDNMINELQIQGYIRPDRRYITWVDANVYCGIGGLASDDSPDLGNVNNGLVPLYSRVDNGCWGLLDQFDSGPNFVSVEAHELMHNFGAVQDTAPNHTNAGHCFDEWDAMCYDDDGNSSTFPLQFVCPESHGPLLDCNHDDYFNTAAPAGSYLATHWNIADSIFFTGGPFPTTQNLSVTKSGAGSGTVTGELLGLTEAQDACESTPGANCDWVDEIGNFGIDCGGSCKTDLSTNMLLILVADASSGSSLAEWSGDCVGIDERPGPSGVQGLCLVEMSSATEVNARFGTSAPRPDLLVALGSGALAGEDVYNSTGAHQKKSDSVKAGKSATFNVRLENDSTKTDDIKLEGSGNSKGFTVKYLQGGTNITSFVVAGTVVFTDIPPNAFATIKVVIDSKSSAKNEKKVVKIVATSKGSSKADTVKATLKT